MRVSIETPAGGERSGVSKAGKLWAQKLNHDYGYIRGTTGRDKDHIDVFLGPNAADGGRNVHVIDQHDPETGEFDEHKVMLGFDDFKDAADAYHSNYEEGWAGGKAITPMSMKDFKAWAFAPGRRLKPAAEHSVGRKTGPQELAGGGLVKALKGVLTFEKQAERVQEFAKTLNQYRVDDRNMLMLPAGRDWRRVDVPIAEGLSDALGVKLKTPERGASMNPVWMHGKKSDGPLPDGLTDKGRDANPLYFSDNPLIATTTEYGNASFLEKPVPTRVWPYLLRPGAVPEVAKKNGIWSGSTPEAQKNIANFLSDQPMTHDLMDWIKDFDEVKDHVPNVIFKGVSDVAPGTQGSGFEMSKQNQLLLREPRKLIDQGDLIPWFSGGKPYAEGGSVTDEPLPQSFMTEFGTPQPGESTGPAFGVFPQMRRRAEKNNDREGAKDLPIQALRGWAAGTLGLPGDLEGLVRMLPGLNETPMLPTSDFYKEWIPGATKNKTANFGTELGSLMGGVGSTDLVRGVGKAAKAGAKALDGMDLSNSPKLAGALRTVFPGAQPMYAVKPKGGNWTQGETFRNSPDLSPATERAWSSALDEFGFPDAGTGSPVENWLNGPFKKYVANDLGTASDPLLKLEAEGKLHMPQAQLLEASRRHGMLNRPTADEVGFMLPVDNFETRGANALHKTTTGRDYRTPWENLSDNAIDYHNPAREIENLRGREIPEWLSKMDDSADIYSLNDNVTGKLGFDHVADYLNEATNAAQELKIHGDLQGLRDFAEAMGVTDSQAAGLVSQGLHIDPADLPRTSVADAVRKTAHWNEWMEANRKSAQAKMFGPDRSLREYPDTGHKWVELKNKGEFAAESDSMGHSVRGYEPDAAGGEPNRHYGLGGWDAIQDGRARILSLRGKDGSPMATVEIGKQEPTREFLQKIPDPARPQNDSPFAMNWTLHDRVNRERSGNGDYAEHAARIAKELGISMPPRITQIKGPGNNPPSQEALAAIQDLVRNGLDDNLKGWSDIRELSNAGLRRIDNSMSSAMQEKLGLPNYVTESELRKAFADTGASERVINNELKRYGFAEGGAVQHFEDGGSVGDPGDGGDGIGGEGTGFGDPAGIATSEGMAADQAAALGFGISDTPGVPTGPTSSNPSQGQTAALGSDQSFSGSGIPGQAISFALSMMLGGLGKGAGMINSLAGNPLGNAFGSSSTGVSSGLNGPGLSDNPSLGGDGGWETAGLSFNPSAPVSAGEINSSLGAAFEPSALGKHSLRVYDPAFTAADARV